LTFAQRVAIALRAISFRFSRLLDGSLSILLLRPPCQNCLARDFPTSLRRQFLGTNFAPLCASSPAQRNSMGILLLFHIAYTLLGNREGNQ
jgi:hypothetical protein